jgi:hypothetical protein
VEQIKSLYPQSCVGDVFERILDKGNGAYVPMLAIMGDPRRMVYEDHATMQHVLRSFSSHPDYPDFPERLRERSYALFVLGYEPVDDYETSWEYVSSVKTGR